MDIEWQSVGRWGVTALPALVALLGFVRGPGALRSKLRHDIEMLEKLPTGSDPHTKLLVYIDAQVARFARIETESSRDWLGFGMALSFSIGAWAAAMWLYAQGDWGWRIGAGFVGVLAFIFMTLVFDAAQRVPRDHKGNKIKA